MSGFAADSWVLLLHLCLIGCERCSVEGCTEILASHIFAFRMIWVLSIGNSGFSLLRLHQNLTVNTSQPLPLTWNLNIIEWAFITAMTSLGEQKWLLLGQNDGNIQTTNSDQAQLSESVNLLESLTGTKWVRDCPQEHGWLWGSCITNKPTSAWVTAH